MGSNPTADIASAPWGCCLHGLPWRRWLSPALSRRWSMPPPSLVVRAVMGAAAGQLHALPHGSWQPRRACPPPPPDTAGGLCSGICNPWQHVTCQFARVVKGVDLRSTAGNCAWARTPQLTCWLQACAPDVAAIVDGDLVFFCGLDSRVVVVPPGN